MKKVLGLLVMMMFLVSCGSDESEGSVSVGGDGSTTVVEGADGTTVTTDGEVDIDLN